MPSRLQQTLDEGSFAVSAEIAPPKGFDFSHPLEVAKRLWGHVDALNVTDFQSASVKASSLALCIDLIQNGIQPVLQMTGRDRNRIAIQGELLSAAHFGIQNILALTGDHPKTGDNPQAKPVFELDAIGILQTAETLIEGKDLGGNELLGQSPEFFLGAVVSPVFDPIEVQLIQMRKKIRCGARFFQTQGIFSLDVARRFKEQTEGYNTKILYGIIPLRSPGMARFMNRKIPGIEVPNDLIETLEKSENKEQDGIKIAAELISKLKEEKLCDGVHIMAIGAEGNVEKILKEAGLWT